MGFAFCTLLEAEVPPYGTLAIDPPSILREELDRLATESGLTSLLAFESYSPEDMDGFLDEDDLADQPPAEWFSAADGLAAVNGLRAYLDAHPGALVGPTDVPTYLSEMAVVLEAASRANVRFRLAIIQ
jgi:hypothetical protein